MSQIFLMLQDMGYEKFYARGIKEDKQSACKALEQLGLDKVCKLRVFKPIHELEHMIMNPNFDLANSKEINYSLVESLFEEIWLHNIRGYDPEFESFIAQGMCFMHTSLVFGNTKTIGDAIQRISAENFTSDARNKVKDSVVYDLLTCFYDRLDEDLTLRGTLAAYSNNTYEFTHALCKSVQRQFSFNKNLILEEQAILWRRFCLHMKLIVLKKQKSEVHIPALPSFPIRQAA